MILNSVTFNLSAAMNTLLVGQGSLHNIGILFNHRDHKVFTLRTRRILCALCVFFLCVLYGSSLAYQSSERTSE